MSYQPFDPPIEGPPMQCSYCYGETDGTWNSLAGHMRDCPAAHASRDKVWAIRWKNDPCRAKYAWVAETGRRAMTGLARTEQEK